MFSMDVFRDKVLKELFGPDRPKLDKNAEKLLDKAAREDWRNTHNAMLKIREGASTAVMHKLAYAQFYFKWIWPDVDWGTQPRDVEKLCRRYQRMDNAEYKDFMARCKRKEDKLGKLPDEEWWAFRAKWIPLWEEFLHEVEDRTENLC